MITEKRQADSPINPPRTIPRDLDCAGPKGSIEKMMKDVSAQVAEDDLHLREMEKRVQEDDKKI